MLKQIRLLTKALIINSYGINEARYTKDKSKKSRFKGFAALAVFIILLLAMYSAGFSVALESLGQGAAVPALLFAAASAIILFFTMFKAGADIFQAGSYQITASLPVTTTAIVISRFIKMYPSNLFFGAVTLLPGAVTHGLCAGVGAAYYINLLLGVFIMPFIPLVIATVLGAGITAISSRMKHKSLAASILGVLLVAAVLGLSIFSPSLEGEISKDAISGIIASATEQLCGGYFPAALFDSAVTGGDYIALLILTLISFAAFALMIFVLQRAFFSICTALSAISAKNNYQMQSLGTSSPLTALLKREFRRYFSSSPYVINTLTGFVLMLVMSISLLVVGVEKIEEAIEFEGIVGAAFPYLLAMLAVISPTTASAVSMEGKHWWVSQTLPIKQRDLWKSKILVNLILAAPFLLISCILFCIALQPSPLMILRSFLIPASFVLFISVLGICVNIRFPLMKWDNDVRVVKQSAAMLITMVSGMIAVGVCALPAVLLADLRDVLAFVTAGVLLLLSAILYGNCNKTDIRTIE